jgi:hypothetical protein
VPAHPKARGATAKRPKVSRAGLDFDGVKRLAAALPGVEESTSYGTRALKVKGKLLARLKEDGETLVLRTSMFEREVLLAAAPKVFFVTEHYDDHPWVLVRLAQVRPEQLGGLLEQAWRDLAPRKLLDARR